tara:strand:- start:2795 stop:6214 length:3420 start_codon:yes stop_codon:yes gene_type:complete
MSIDLANKYQKKTDKQHVLDNPDTYTGSMTETEYDTYIYDSEQSKIISKEIKTIPGLYKLFDEGIVNCRDHQVRMEQLVKKGVEHSLPVTSIDININDEGVITFYNDGNGIDVEMHPEHKIWIPELIFGHLRTSTNYDKSEKKIVGGKNGFGVKLIFIWADEGEIETVDHIRGKKYTQKFTNNLNIIHEPEIKKCKKKPYTKITFKPDYKRLGIDRLSDDILNLFKRRVYDIAAVTDKKVKVKYNNDIVNISNFQQYVDLYIGNKTDTTRIYEEANEHWEYAVCMAPKEEFTQVSFVNGIYTGKGGKHIDYIMNQIIRKLSAYIKKKKKIDVKSSTIKEQIFIFVRCNIENPTFDSQTKDFMNTPSNTFGTSCTVSDKFVDKIAKMGIMDNACALTEVKDNKAAKKTDGSKTRSIRGIPKLVDANFAGTTKSNLCSIIFCEGDSAKAGIVSGLSKEDRNIIGVYPMRGKLFNVRGESQKRILENKEIAEIKQILGIETGKKYDANIVSKKLRYSKVIFMTDQDLDGSHIKGLGINLFDSEWKSLLEIPGFIGFINTPILKAQKGSKKLSFYNDGEWNEWCKKNSISGWKIKYYKGLGTSTSKEFKEYFEDKKIVTFTNIGNENIDCIDKAFNKTRSDDRKGWLENYNREEYLDTNQKQVSYDDFINKEMIHFSKYDCARSIPNIMDGLKTSQRKILFTAFRRKLTNEIKVAQFSGSVSEISCYHHGESSLNGAIVNMAQDYVGSNNINLFVPNGQFGTRLLGGNDSASERYIHTNLNKITRYIYPESDDGVLDYLDDDGTPVEPVYYAPIIPMVLVNGSKGIGTGFSTEIMCYNPSNIIEYIRAHLKNEELPNILPYYEGFKGTITPLSKTKWLFKGVYDIISETDVHITELPVGMWTSDYKKYIEDLIEGGEKNKKSKGVVRDYNDMSTHVTVDFTIRFLPGVIQNMIVTETEQGCNALEKLLKLYSTKSTSNIHIFDENEKLVKHNTPEEITNHFIGVRMNVYINRKQHQVKLLEHDTMVLTNKGRFISDILNDKLDLRRKKRDVVNALLSDEGYDVIDNDTDYKYLVRLPMDSVTQENYDKLMQDKNNKIHQLQTLKATSEKDIWLSELDNLEKQYSTYKDTRNNVSFKKKIKVKK